MIFLKIISHPNHPNVYIQYLVNFIEILPKIESLTKSQIVWITVLLSLFFKVLNITYAIKIQREYLKPLVQKTYLKKFKLRLKIFIKEISADWLLLKCFRVQNFSFKILLKKSWLSCHFKRIISFNFFSNGYELKN